MASNDACGGRSGTLVLVSDSVEALTTFEAIDSAWGVVSILLGPSPPDDLVSLLGCRRGAVIAALGPAACDFMLGIPQEALARASGLCLYDRRPGAESLRSLRTRLPDVLCAAASTMSAFRRELATMLERIGVIRAFPTITPLLTAFR